MSSTPSSRIAPLLHAPDALQLYSSKSSNIKFIDGSWHLNKGTRNAKLEYEQQRIPGARYFDIDDVCDKSNPLPHMLPTEAHFSQHMTELGISNDDHVIVYVKPDSFSGPRVWWMFNVYGHKKVSLLNGGIAAWIKAGETITFTCHFV